MRAVFLGNELGILESLRHSSDIVGVYVPAPASWHHHLRRWPLQHPPARDWAKKFWDKHPGSLRRWRRLWSRYYRTADHARALGLPLLHATGVKGAQFHTALAKLMPDIVVVANFGEILPATVLPIPRHGFINFHPSLLPRYRGPTPVARMILHGESVGGVTWHRVVTAVDAGDILIQQAFTIDADDTSADVTTRAATLAAALLPTLLDQLQRGICVPRPQLQEHASFFPKLTPAEKRRLRHEEEARRHRMQQRAHP